jgi:hypothetical protein
MHPGRPSHPPGLPGAAMTGGSDVCALCGEAGLVGAGRPGGAHPFPRPRMK